MVFRNMSFWPRIDNFAERLGGFNSVFFIHDVAAALKHIGVEWWTSDFRSLMLNLCCKPFFFFLVGRKKYRMVPQGIWFINPRRDRCMSQDGGFRS